MLDNIVFRCGSGCEPGYGFNTKTDACVKCTSGSYSARGWSDCLSCSDPVPAPTSWEWGTNEIQVNSDSSSCEFHPTTREGCISTDSRACEWIYFDAATPTYAEGAAACLTAGGALATVSADEAGAFDAFLTANNVALNVCIEDGGSDCTGKQGYACERLWNKGSFADDFTNDWKGSRAGSAADKPGPQQWTVNAGGIDVEDVKGSYGNVIDLHSDGGSGTRVTEISTKASFSVEVGQLCSLSVDLKGGEQTNSRGPVRFELGTAWSSADIMMPDAAWHTEIIDVVVTATTLSPVPLTVHHETTNRNKGVLMDNVVLSCPGSCPLEYFFADPNCQACAGICGPGQNETAPCRHDSNRECGVCDAGFLCSNGIPTACTAPEGFYCPAGYIPETERRSGSDLDGVPCDAGYYCKGDTAAPVPCTSAVGFYCPAAFAPGADTVEEGLAGKPCPPNMLCSGTVFQPEDKPQVCDLVQACGDFANATCGARQSTFYKLDDPPVSYATDASASTCMKTADAVGDANAQWVRVDLGSEQLVQTVRFRASGAASDFTVKVAATDAEPQPETNPSAGSALPEAMEACAEMSEASAGVLEAGCAAAVKGRFVFISRSAANAILEVCDVEVFAHECLPDAEVSCPIGLQPSPCTAEEQFCPGCVPCPAGTYSDKEGPYECTPCPGTAAYDEQPYSPPGSTSEFQCEGDAFLDGTSTLEVAQVLFNQSIDAWIVDVAVEQAPKIQINGLSALYISSGGSDVPTQTYTASQFPCRADTSRSAGLDLSAALSETLCCLQDMREDYVMTKIFRDFTDGLDLVAANDICDADDGSDKLVNADLEVWGEGSFFVDVNGDSFANPITIEPIEAPAARRANPEGYEQTQYARITIPDAELFKISRGTQDSGSLTDTRELFIGLLDMLPTGTRVVDSANQQIVIQLTRTQYGTFAAYGEQNIDYDFISYLNARAHRVVSTTDVPPRRESLLPDQYYLEVTYVYDNRLSATDEALPVGDLDAVQLSIGETATYPCDSASALPLGFVAVVEIQDCGPTELNFADDNKCPQVSIPDDKFGRIYIPLPQDPNTDTVSVSFQLDLTGSIGRAADLTVAMDIVVSDFVSWCDANSGSIDLAERVIPSITIGTESDNPPRLTSFGGDDPEDFSTGAETLQDGLITLELALNETNDLDDNLEVFMEDVLVIQVNPGSTTTAAQIKAAGGDYIPSYTYNPDTRDATLHIPDELKAACSNMSHSESFFGCVYKHVLAEEEITNPEWAYKVGSAAATSAQDFMETMLGDGTAAVAARELGRDYEASQVGDGFATRKKIGLWINPGHVWGQTVHNSKYSLSQDVVVYVLFGVRSGVDGTERRMLLQAGSDGRSAILQTIKYEVTAASLMESVMEDVVAVEVKARMALPAEEACAAPEELRAACARRLRAAVEPHASAVATVQCVAVSLEDEAACDGARRASAADVTVAADAVIALDSTDVSSERGVFLDIEAVVESGSVMTMAQAAGRTFEPTVAGNGGAGDGVTTTDADGEEEGEGGVNVVLIAGAAGAAAVVMLVALVAKWALCGARREAAPLTEVVSAGVVPEVEKLEKPASLDKGEVENMLYGALPAFAREEQGDVTLDSLLPRSRPGTQAEFKPLQ